MCHPVMVHSANLRVVMSWIIAVVALIVLGFILDREIYFYEGVHLGPRLQAWLYNRWAKKYDEGKRLSQLQDEEMLAQPLLEALRDVPGPFILDFATGTGRLSYALQKQEEFQGNIIALDLSQGMLEQAAAKLRGGSSTRVEFLRHLSLPLPFPDSAFDAVCALEVLELFPNMDEPLRELTRILRPGGVLLTSRGTEESGRRAKVKNIREFTALLQRQGIEHIEIVKWWRLFDRVIAVKQGSSQPATFRNLSAVLKCSSCTSTDWMEVSDHWQCHICGKNLARTREGILLN
jgi:ubiquinone/menaquinone biosynthesis C-methylase UbiE